MLVTCELSQSKKVYISMKLYPRIAKYLGEDFIFLFFFFPELEEILRENLGNSPLNKHVYVLYSSILIWIFYPL